MVVKERRVDQLPVHVGEYDRAQELQEEQLQEAQGEVIEAEIEEADPKRVLPTPTLPSQSDVEKHREDHLPYASWCDHCVEGRGREMGHQHVDRSHRAISTISFDYLFMNSKGHFDFEKTDEDGVDDGAARDKVKILVVKDSKNKAIFAHAVPSKGVDEDKFAVSVLMSDIKWLGYTRLILKSDNEPAIVKLLTESLKSIRVSTDPAVDQVLEEHPPPFDSQANGDVESAAKAVRGQTRTLQSCLESRLGHRIPVSHPIYAWLISHAAMMITVRVRGHDGQTAYQRIRGRPWSNRLLGFGEKCRFKIRAKEAPDTYADGNRFHQGIFVGFSRSDGQYLIFHEGVVRPARTVMRLPSSLKWEPTLMEKVSVTPFDQHEVQQPDVMFKRDDAV